MQSEFLSFVPQFASFSGVARWVFTVTSSPFRELEVVENRSHGTPFVTTWGRPGLMVGGWKRFLVRIYSVFSSVSSLASHLFSANFLQICWNMSRKELYRKPRSSSRNLAWIHHSLSAKRLRFAAFRTNQNSTPIWLKWCRKLLDQQNWMSSQFAAWSICSSMSFVIVRICNFMILFSGCEIGFTDDSLHRFLQKVIPAVRNNPALLEMFLMTYFRHHNAKEMQKVAMDLTKIDPQNAPKHALVAIISLILQVVVFRYWIVSVVAKCFSRLRIAQTSPKRKECWH